MLGLAALMGLFVAGVAADSVMSMDHHDDDDDREDDEAGDDRDRAGASGYSDILAYAMGRGDADTDDEAADDEAADDGGQVRGAENHGPGADLAGDGADTSPAGAAAGDAGAARMAQGSAASVPAGSGDAGPGAEVVMFPMPADGAQTVPPAPDGDGSVLLPDDPSLPDPPQANEAETAAILPDDPDGPDPVFPAPGQPDPEDGVAGGSAALLPDDPSLPDPPQAGADGATSPEAPASAGPALVKAGDGEILSGGAGDEFAPTEAGQGTVAGAAGDDSPTGGGGDDRGAGGTCADRQAGRNGEVLRAGGDGADGLHGGTGDTLSGSAGDVDDARILGPGADSLAPGDWVADGDAATIHDYDPAEDRLIVVYDAAAHPDPVLEVRGDGGDTVSIVLDGVALAHVPGGAGLAPSGIELRAAGA